MRCSRAGAVVMALVLATAGLVACLHPRTAAAARDCCAKQCHHDAPAERALDCCRARETPAEHVGVGGVVQAAELVSPVPAAVVPAPPSASLAPRGERGHDPPPVALFLQRCALLL